VLDKTPKDGVLIVVGQKGGFTESGFRASFFKLLRKLHGEGKVGAGLTFHGLRHTAATALADAGCDDRDIMAVTGHSTAAMVRRYTEKADRRKRATAAIAKLDAHRKRTDEA
jgi:integrase